MPKVIRANVNPAELGVDIKDIRKTRTSNLLVEVEASLSRETKWVSLLAFVELDEQLAIKLDQEGHIKIDWVNCRVRTRARLSRCYSYQGYGHVAIDCKAVNRSNLC